MMVTGRNSSISQPSAGSAAIVRAITVIMGTVVGLTFLFGFGNVLSFALRLGVPVWVAPLVAPAIDLSILGLLLGIRHLALIGASADVLWPARRLLIFASVVTLALNVADPLVAGEYGKAAFDAVGPLLLIGWAEVGPGFLQAIGSTAPPGMVDAREGAEQPSGQAWELSNSGSARSGAEKAELRSSDRGQHESRTRPLEVLLDQARQEDATHRVACQKPISADTLRVRLGIGATPARRLVKIIRAEFQTNSESSVPALMQVGIERFRHSGSAPGSVAGQQLLNGTGADESADSAMREPELPADVPDRNALV